MGPGVGVQRRDASLVEPAQGSLSRADGSRKNPTTEADRLNRYPQKITEVSPFGSQKDYGCQPFGPRKDYGSHPGVGFGNVKDL